MYTLRQIKFGVATFTLTVTIITLSSRGKNGYKTFLKDFSK